MQMVDRQIISYETAMETIGYYFPKELKRLESEKKTREEKGILVAQKAPTQGGGNSSDPSNTGGRPRGGDKEHSRPRSQNKPKTPSGINALGKIREDVEIAFASKIENEEIKKMFLSSAKAILSEDKFSLVEYMIDNSECFDNKDSAISLIDKISLSFK